MKDTSAFDSQFQELNRRDRIGAEQGDPIEITPPPLKYYAGSILCVIISVVLLGIFAFLFFGEEPSGDDALLLLYFGILFGIPGVLILVRRSWNRCRLQAHEKGFSLKRGRKEKIVLFDETVSITLAEKEKLSNGVPVGVDRRLIVDSPHQKISLRQVSLV